MKCALVTAILGQEKTVLEMQQENVPLQDLEFQHSTITFLDTKTDKVNTLQINRIKPVDKESKPVTAYTLFLGRENPEGLGTIIISDESKDGGLKGEDFVVLKSGTFDYEQTIERFSSNYMEKAYQLLKELKDKEFQDPRVLQAVWQVDKDKKTILTNGVINGKHYAIKSQDGERYVPGLHISRRNPKLVEITNSSGQLIAKVQSEHFRGEEGDDAIVLTFLRGQTVVFEAKRDYRDKSEIETTHGTATTVGVGFTLSGELGLGLGWSDIELERPVNFQNENQFLYSFGERTANLTEQEIEDNRRATGGILVLLGGMSILDGFNFQDTEIEWLNSIDQLIDDAKDQELTPDMGFWLELPVDATETGRQAASELLGQD